MPLRPAYSTHPPRATLEELRSCFTLYMLAKGLWTEVEEIRQAELDSRLAFDEKEHKYTYFAPEGGAFTPQSVTRVVHDLFPPFDSEAVAKGMILREDFPHAERYKDYRGLVAAAGGDIPKLVSMILQKWQIDAYVASALGHEVHAAMECRMKEPDYNMHVERGLEYEFGRKYLCDLEAGGWMPLYAERRICQPKWGIAGSVDAMFVHKESRRCILVDWKRSKAITRFAFGGKTGLGFASVIPDCNYYHYVLQLNFYCVMLESEPYNMNFDNMYIVRLHPNSTTQAAEVIPVPCMREMVRRILSARCPL